MSCFPSDFPWPVSFNRARGLGIHRIDAESEEKDFSLRLSGEKTFCDLCVLRAFALKFPPPPSHLVPPLKLQASRNYRVIECRPC